MEIATIVMNANNLIMTATLAPATDVIGVQAMLPATVCRFMTMVTWTISYLVATVQALSLSLQATAVQNPKTFLGENEKRYENKTIFWSGMLSDLSSSSNTYHSLYFLDFAVTLCIRVKNGSLI
jgi:hypothetical protein